MPLPSEEELRQKYPEAVCTAADSMPDAAFDSDPTIVSLRAEEARLAEECFHAFIRIKSVLRPHALEAMLQNMGTGASTRSRFEVAADSAVAARHATQRALLRLKLDAAARAARS